MVFVSPYQEAGGSMYKESAAGLHVTSRHYVWKTAHLPSQGTSFLSSPFLDFSRLYGYDNHDILLFWRYVAFRVDVQSMLTNIAGDVWLHVKLWCGTCLPLSHRPSLTPRRFQGLVIEVLWCIMAFNGCMSVGAPKKAPDRHDIILEPKFMLLSSTGLAAYSIHWRSVAKRM